MMQCPNCWEGVRGDVKECPHCGMELHVSEWTKGEQRAIDREAAGLCENCGRAIAVCDAEPCIEEG